MFWILEEHVSNPFPCVLGCHHNFKWGKDQQKIGQILARLVMVARLLL